MVTIDDSWQGGRGQGAGAGAGAGEGAVSKRFNRIHSRFQLQGRLSFYPFSLSLPLSGFWISILAFVFYCSEIGVASSESGVFFSVYVLGFGRR